MNVQPLSRCYDKNLKHLLLWLMDTLRVIDQVFIMPGGGTLMHSKVRSSAACPEPGSGRGTGRLHLADAAGPGCFAVGGGVHAKACRQIKTVVAGCTFTAIAAAREIG